MLCFSDTRISTHFQRFYIPFAFEWTDESPTSNNESNNMLWNHHILWVFFFASQFSNDGNIVMATVSIQMVSVWRISKIDVLCLFGRSINFPVTESNNGSFSSLSLSLRYSRFVFNSTNLEHTQMNFKWMLLQLANSVVRVPKWNAFYKFNAIYTMLLYANESII